MISRSPPSLTRRLAALFAVSSGAIVLVSGVLLYLASDAHFIEQDTHDLHERTQIVSNHLQLALDPITLATALDRTLISHHELAVELRDSQGQLRYARNAEVFADNFSPPAAQAPAISPWTSHHPALLNRVLYQGQLWRATQTRLAESGDVLRLAVGIDHHQAFLNALLRWLITGGVAVVASSFWLGLWLARRELRPLQKISANATLISANELSKRLDETAMPAEVLPLVRDLNAMLTRLDDAFRRLTEFSSDIAHELRTPVSNLVTQTEVALTRARSDEEYRDILGSNLEEFGRLGRMISDMLFLARADHGLVVPDQRSVDLAHEADTLIGFFEALAEDRHLRLQRSGEATTTGEPLMLRRAMANLISNAIRHATPDSVITIHLSRNEGSATVDIRNQGPTIPAEHLPRLFDRFYRGDAARHGSDEHTGLGLAIVKSIIEAHGGQIYVSSDESCTRFHLTLQ